MKLKYERFEGLGCLYVRGTVDEKFSKLLQVGVETIAKDLDETLVVNLVQAKIDLSQMKSLLDFKKKVAGTTKQQLYWIAKDRTIGDFQTIDIFITRMSGVKSRQIGERIKSDDVMYDLTTQMQNLQAKILKLGGDEDNVVKLIMENTSLKEQKRILEAVVSYQTARAKVQVLEPSKDEEILPKTNEAYDLLKQYYGKDIDL